MTTIINPYRFGNVIVAEATSILAALTAWWSMDDNAASSTVLDSHGSNAHPMTARNNAGTINTSTLSNATTKIQNRALQLNNQDSTALYIPRSDTGLDSADADHSFGGWFLLATSAGTTKFVIGRVGSAFAKLHGWIFIDGADDKVKARYSSNGTTAAATADSGITASAVNFALIVFTYNKTGSLLEIRYREVGAGALTKVTTALSGNISTTSNDTNFAIGEGLEGDATFDAGNNRNAVNYADECFYLTKAITDAEFGYLYNGGTGRTYAQLVADAS